MVRDAYLLTSGLATVGQIGSVSWALLEGDNTEQFEECKEATHKVLKVLFSAVLETFLAFNIAWYASRKPLVPLQ